MRLYLDIETIPSQSRAVHEQIAATITAPGNISKPETIAKWEAESKPSLVKGAVARTSFDGSVGHICCIGWAWGDASPVSKSVVNIADEKDVFLSVMSDMENIPGSAWESARIIGHNVANFDIRFLWQRAIVLGVRMPSWFPRDPKPLSNDVFDTMTAFSGARGSISMDRLCQALGFERKGDVDGSMIGQMWAEGRHEDIAAYCRADVERTRKIHRKMLVAFGDDA